MRQPFARAFQSVTGKQRVVSCRVVVGHHPPAWCTPRVLLLLWSRASVCWWHTYWNRASQYKRARPKFRARFPIGSFRSVRSGSFARASSGARDCVCVYVRKSGTAHALYVYNVHMCIHIFKRGSQIKKDFHDLIASFVSFVLSFVIESSRCGDVYRVCAPSSPKESQENSISSHFGLHLSKSEEGNTHPSLVALEKKECLIYETWSTDFGLFSWISRWI